MNSYWMNNSKKKLKNRTAIDVERTKYTLEIEAKTCTDIFFRKSVNSADQKLLRNRKSKSGEAGLQLRARANKRI